MANVAGPMRLTQLLAPMLIKTSSSPGRGRGVIVNVSTAGAGIPVPLLGFQLATKVSHFCSREESFSRADDEGEGCEPDVVRGSEI